MPTPSSLSAVEAALGIKLTRTAPDEHQLRRPQYRNHYLLDEQENVIGLHLSEAIQGELRLGEPFQHLQLLKIKSPDLSKITFEVDMPHLDLIDLSGCGLKSFTLGAGFQRLKTLILRHNQIQSFVLQGEAMNSLEIVDLSYNDNLLEIHLSSELPRLGYFYAYGGGLRSFTSEQDLPNLQVLELRKSELQELYLEHCPRMERLDLSGLQLKSFPPNLMAKLSKLSDLQLKGNPIDNLPKEIFDKDENVFEDVQNFLQAQLSSGLILNSEAKCIFFGNSSVGKTTISHQLREGEFDSTIESTHGILINSWSIVSQENYPDNLQAKIQEAIKEAKKDYPDALTPDVPENIVLHVWDFGGQEYYHATHRLFLNSNVMYLLLWDEETNYNDENSGNYHYEYYWKENINYYANPNITLIVQNKAGERAVVDSDRRLYKVVKRSEDLEDSITEYELDIKKLKAKIVEHLANLDHLAKPFPRLYDVVRKALRNDQRPFLRFGEYESFCSDIEQSLGTNILTDASSLETMTTFLQDTGSLICYRYQENCSEELKDYVFINPQWVTKAIYQILDKNILEEQNGVFDEAHVATKMQENQVSAGVWIDLMEKFELIFRIKDEDEGKLLFVTPPVFTAGMQESKSLKILLAYKPTALPYTLFP